MHSKRIGFTLVEMMVAMALTIFVMVILSQCFIAGLESFSQLKAIGDMNEQMRTATTLLRDDLRQDHFDGKRRLSDPYSYHISNRTREGFFVIGSGYPYKPFVPWAAPAFPAGPPFPPFPHLSSSSKVLEGVEDGINSYRFNDHYLHFTAKKRGNQRDKFFAAPAPLLGLNGVRTNYVDGIGDSLFLENGNVFHSPWAEIAYVLLPTGTTANPSIPPAGVAPPTPLFALYRCEYAILPQTADANNMGIIVNPADASPYVNIAGNPKLVAPNVVMDFYSPGDMARGFSRRTFNPYAFFTPPPSSNANPPRGATLVLSNVVSFQVMALIDLNILTAEQPVGPFPPGTVKITTAGQNGLPGPHGYSVGQTVKISNAGVLGYNGTYLITGVPDPTSFTYQVAQPLTPSIGGVASGDFGELGEIGHDANPNTGQARNYHIPFDTANYVERPTDASGPQIFLPPGTPFGPLTPQVPQYSIQGLQIILRIWDPKSQLTRQVTILQDM